MYLDMNEIRHDRLMRLAGIRSKAGFKELRDMMGIGRTEAGAPRRLDNHEAVQELLVSRLGEWKFRSPHFSQYSRWLAAQWTQ